MQADANARAKGAEVLLSKERNRYLELECDKLRLQIELAKLTAPK